MYRGKVVAAVVPAYNEERLVGRVITTMPAYVDHIVVVDDASTDGTSAAASATGDPRLVLIRHERNTGVGGAVVDGHKRALALGADAMCVMAGDAQMDPNYLQDLLDPVVEGRCEMAKANRFFSSSSYRGMPTHRVIGNVVLSFLNKLASGYWHIFDPQNGYVVVRREALAAVDLDRIAKGYSLENDFLIALNILDARVLDVPVPAVYGEEASSIRLRRVMPSLAALLFRGFWRRIFRKYVIFSFSPIALLLFSGLALVLLGSVVGAWVVAETLGEPVATTGSVLLSVGPLLVGIQLLIFALVLDIQESSKLVVPSDRFGSHAMRDEARRLEPPDPGEPRPPETR